jgi:P-type Mg2+ transporter
VLRTGLGLLANPLVLILLAASVVSSIVGKTLDAGIIVSIVLVSVGLDFFQIFHSEQAASKLQSLVTLTASVWRDAQLTDIPIAMWCRAMSSSYARAIWSRPTRR